MPGLDVGPRGRPGAVEGGGGRSVPDEGEAQYLRGLQRTDNPPKPGSQDKE